MYQKQMSVFIFILLCIATTKTFSLVVSRHGIQEGYKNLQTLSRYNAKYIYSQAVLDVTFNCGIHAILAGVIMKLYFLSTKSV